MIEPTREQLERAWRELARPGWAPIDELQTAHCRYLLIRGRAVALANPQAGAPAAPPVHTSHWGSLRVPQLPATLDLKRRAAGEREESDQ